MKTQAFIINTFSTLILSICIITPIANGKDLSYSHMNYSVPDEMYQQINEILNEYDGEILQPEDVGQIDTTNITDGTAISFTSSQPPQQTYKFLRNDSGYSYFELVSDFGGSIGKSNRIYRTNGITDEITSHNDPNNYSRYPSEENICKFQIGTCIYKSGKSEKSVNVSFNNGIWTTSRELGRVGVAYLIKNRIYDKNGMLIYEGSFSNRWATGRHEYTIRVKQ